MGNGASDNHIPISNTYQMGFSWSDFDNDGDLDALINLGNSNKSRLFINKSNNANSWISIRLKGLISNSFGIGAKIKAYSGSDQLLREVSTSNKSSQNAHFGLGIATNIDRLVVEWPSGIVQELTDVAVNQFLTITEPVSPSIPLNLSAAATSSSQINLSWSDSEYEDEYLIERSIGNNINFVQLATVGANFTTYNDISPGTATNYYRIRASNSNGNSSYSNEVSAIVFPNAPSSLNAGTISNSQINLTWADNSSNETGFTIERSVSNNSNFAFLTTVGSGTTNYNNTGLSSATTYYYRVKSINSSGGSNYSNEASAATLCTTPQPTSNSSSLSYSDVRDTRMKLTWTKGNGGKRLVVARKTYAVSKAPVDGNINYSASSNFGSGYNLGSSNYVVYNGTGNTVTITGLSASSTYHYAVYEYNENTGCYLDRNYLTSSKLTGSRATLCSIPSQPTSISGTITSLETSSTIYFSWAKGNGAKRLVIAKYASSVNANPIDGTSYTANSTLGFGSNLGSGNYAVYNGTGSSFTLRGLSAGRTYYLAIYEYNENTGCYIKTNYLTSSKRTGSGTTCINPQPTLATSNLSFSNVTTSSMRLNWTKGNGNRRIIVARKNYAVNKTPLDNGSFNASSTFGNGYNFGSGNYVVYNGTGTYAYVYGLAANSAYHYAIYEYNFNDGCIPTTNYMTLKLIGSRSTLTGGGGGDPCLTQNLAYKEQSKHKGDELQSRLRIPDCSLARVYNKSKVIYVDFSSNLTAKSEIQVFDLNGRLVRYIDNTSNQHTNVEIDFNNVSDNTLYLVRVTNEYEIVTKKLILTQ